jgi:phosphotransferase system enzyme I (PtsI)
MCGEMAGDIMSIPILLGLGLDAFSMSATSIAKARMIINNLKYSECKQLAIKTINLNTQSEVNEVVKKFLTSKKIIN